MAPLYLLQVWFQNRRAKWRKNSESLQRGFSNVPNCRSLRPGGTETAEVGFWFAEKSLNLRRLLVTSAAKYGDFPAAASDGADVCRLNLNATIAENAENDRLTLAADFSSLLHRHYRQVYTPLCDSLQFSASPTS